MDTSIITQLRRVVSGDSTKARRRAQIEALPKSELSSRHTEGCRVLPDRQALLAALRGGVVAECGVAYGDFTADILRICRPRTLYLIDAWSRDRFNAGLEKVRSRFAGSIADGIVQIRVGLSTDVLAEFADGALDWVYIDTDHSYLTTLAELRLAKLKVKPDGVIAGHDYSVAGRLSAGLYGVIPACHQFCVEENWRYAYLTLDPTGVFSFALRRIT
jgi:predicted O-methyltransferase YrrM